MDQLRRERLEAQVAELEQLLESRAASGAEVDQWKPYAERSLAAVREALKGDQEQCAWAHVNQAFRFLCYGMEDAERQQRAKALRREAEQKLRNWCKGADLDILGRDADPHKIPTKSDLVLALPGQLSANTRAGSWCAKQPVYMEPRRRSAGRWRKRRFLKGAVWSLAPREQVQGRRTERPRSLSA